MFSATCDWFCTDEMKVESCTVRPSENLKRRNETENIRAVVKIKMEGKRPRGRPRLPGKDTVHESLEDQRRTDHTVTVTGRDGKTPATMHRKTAAKGEKLTKVEHQLRHQLEAD